MRKLPHTQPDPERYVSLDPAEFHRMQMAGYTVCREVFPNNHLKRTRYSAKAKDVVSFYRAQLHPWERSN
jgi:hypothetical protein